MGAGGPRQLPSIKLKSTNRVPLYATYDMDGDGKDEIVCVEQQRTDGYYPCTIVQYTGNTSSKSTEVRLTLPQNSDKEIEKLFVGDYNNDGLQDLILLCDGGYKIYFNNGGTASSSSVFPLVISCLVCNKKLRATKSGRFRCSGCRSILAINENGEVSLG